MDRPKNVIADNVGWQKHKIPLQYPNDLLSDKSNIITRAQQLLR